MTKKSKPVYIDREGNRFSGKNQVERHRLIFNRRFYSGRALSNYDYSDLYHSYRIFPGFVDNMKLDFHKEIHQNVEPPIKPHEDLISLILSEVEIRDLSSGEILENTINYLDRLASSQLEREVTPRQVEEASLLVDNFIRQKALIDLGKVSLLQAGVF